MLKDSHSESMLERDASGTDFGNGCFSNNAVQGVTKGAGKW